MMSLIYKTRLIFWGGLAGLRTWVGGWLKDHGEKRMHEICHLALKSNCLREYVQFNLSKRKSEGDFTKFRKPE